MTLRRRLLWAASGEALVYGVAWFVSVAGISLTLPVLEGTLPRSNSEYRLIFAIVSVYTMLTMPVGVIVGAPSCLIADRFWQLSWWKGLLIGAAIAFAASLSIVVRMRRADFEGGAVLL